MLICQYKFAPVGVSSARSSTIKGFPVRFTVPRHAAAVLLAAAMMAALYFGVIFDAHKPDLTTTGI